MPSNNIDDACPLGSTWYRRTPPTLPVRALWSLGYDLVPSQSFSPALSSYTLLPRQGSSACCCILTRRASEGSASEPALARRKICEIFESPLHAGLQAEGPVAGVSG